MLKKTDQRTQITDRSSATKPEMSRVYQEDHNFLRRIPENSHVLSPAESLIKIKQAQKDYRQNSYHILTKRVFDVFVSLLAIMLLFPWLFPIIALLIRMDSKGPIFFVQERNGLNLKTFKCCKFRSMIVNNLSDNVPTLENDPRITRIGAILRKYSLDELPQFFNVLIGEMSVVGPRPHMTNETNSFAMASSHFYKRHLVKPGITGLAQIRNCRGPINNFDDLSERLKFDLFYVRNASLAFDIEIVIGTLLMMFKDDEKAKD
jgi:putative colanic acid biosynthesis UDP-glucose lipid carrier transferase